MSINTPLSITITRCPCGTEGTQTGYTWPMCTMKCPSCGREWKTMSAKCTKCKTMSGTPYYSQCHKCGGEEERGA